MGDLYSDNYSQTSKDFFLNPFKYIYYLESFIELHDWQYRKFFNI